MQTAENDRSLSVEKEKTNMENDKSQSKEAEKELSTEKKRSTPLEYVKRTPSENENSSIPSQDFLAKPSATEETTESILPSETAASGAKDSNYPTLPGEQMGHSAVKDGSNSTNPKDSGSPVLPGEQTGPCAVKDGSDSALPMVISSTEPKDSREHGLPLEVVTSFENEVNELKWTGETPDSMEDSGNGTSLDVVKYQIHQWLRITSLLKNKNPHKRLVLSQLLKVQKHLVHYLILLSMLIHNFINVSEPIVVFIVFLVSSYFLCYC